MKQKINELIHKYISALEKTENDANNYLVVMIKKLMECKSYIVLSGIGKSAIVAKKISSTMNSLGIKSFYIHPVDALHGDLGQIDQNDFILFISKSGESQEVITLMRHLKQMGNLLFSITMDSENTICKMSDYNFKVPLGDEACYMNLAPTTSTVVFLVIGDIISILLSQNRGFTQADYKNTHPGGNIGKKLNSTD